MDATRNAKIITFYSYKGGTGRSMALSNVAWVLASLGQRVLVIDWDLEAPGLHRYFEPFLTDHTLENSTGVIDFVLEFASAAVSGGKREQSKDWFSPYANLISHASSLQWEFALGGTLDFVPAGRQDAAYASRVNSFNWQHFYEKLGGGILLEEVKRRLRPLYDYILIDSRTGVSDTSGVCTVQMPDELVVCFTLNRQSILGAAAVAISAVQQRKSPDGASNLKVWPVPMRVEFSEKDRLETARILARSRFTNLLTHLGPAAADAYWGKIEVPYQPYYAYEEVLATFADRPRQSSTLLSSMETIATYLTEGRLDLFSPSDESKRLQGLAQFMEKSAWDLLQELKLMAEEYSWIRKGMDAGNERTYLMDALVARVQTLAGRKDAALAAEYMFKEGTDGSRVVALALARNDPQRGHVEMALSGISDAKSPFEQFHALLLANQLVTILDPTALGHINSAVKSQLGKMITPKDQSRWGVAQQLLKTTDSSSLAPVWPVEEKKIESIIEGQPCTMVEGRPASFVRYEDADEKHGDWVGTRRVHTLQLPRLFRLSQYLVTNEMYFAFVQSGGYENDLYWSVPTKIRKRFVTSDGSLGPSGWLTSSYAANRGLNPVSGICYFEAEAYVKWCNLNALPIENWKWVLPPEDIWEFVARTESGLIYPWGDAFEQGKCNSSESGIGDTCEVTKFESGASRMGCCDLAGNVWEFVSASDSGKDSCVLRGGSFKNNRYQVRSYLRLFGVPKLHRPPDFGFRLAQIEDSPDMSLKKGMPTNQAITRK
jgi:formylglycine-generating enzyme required for sulfatase activity